MLRDLGEAGRALRGLLHDRRVRKIALRDAGTWYAAWAILRTRSCLGTDRRAQNRATGCACGEVSVRDFAHPTGPGARVGSLVGVALAALGLFIHIPAAQAQGPRSWRIENNGVRHVVIPINKSKTFRLDQPFATAIVGSPEIADALPMSDRSLYLQAKKIGTTNVSVFDTSMRLLGVLDVEVAPDVGDVQEKVRAATGSRGIRRRDATIGHARH